jgi:hypothetical protein
MTIVPAGLEEERDRVLESGLSEHWILIDLDKCTTDDAKHAALRLNSFASLFYFGKVVLGHSRFTNSLHGYMCRTIERDRLRLALEIPRDHFKTSVASVCAPMWWALPFSARDEELMRIMGYRDEWIRWMYRAHSSSARTLIASEVIGNARKIGVKIAGHYESNATFRHLFPEILPDRNCRWNQDSLTHKRLDGIYHGEGTYDFLGVKGALQSRHYDRQVLDDLVGEKAIYSDSVMEQTIEWVKRLAGAFDSRPDNPNDLGDTLIPGNRWSFRDLSSYLREHQSSRYVFETHSAIGGCCPMHPPGIPIFPEEFSIEKLDEIRSTEGAYNFACQYENNPISPSAARFKLEWLRHYVRKEQLVQDERDREHRVITLEHEVQQGEVIEDMNARNLDRVLILDPKHSADKTRCRHGIAVLGTNVKPRRIYLLEAWAGDCGFEAMIDQALKLAVNWRVHHFYVETVAGQAGWYYYFLERVKQLREQALFTVRQLKTDRSSGGKARRIEGMEPIYESGLFWTPRVGGGVGDFKGEYSQYPNGRTVDLLDVIGYLPQTWSNVSRNDVKGFVQNAERRSRAMLSTIGPAGY